MLTTVILYGVEIDDHDGEATSYIGEPQTHLGLMAMIKEVVEDNDGQISFREVTQKDKKGKGRYSGNRRIESHCYNM